MTHWDVGLTLSLFPICLSTLLQVRSRFPGSLSLSGPGLFFQAWMRPLKPSTLARRWGWPLGDRAWQWEAPGRPRPEFTLPGWGRWAGGEEWRGEVGGREDFARKRESKNLEISETLGQQGEVVNVKAEHPPWSALWDANMSSAPFDGRSQKPLMDFNGIW